MTNKTLTAQEAVTLLHRRIFGNDVPHEVGVAVAVLIDQALQLEQTLDLIDAGVQSAFRAKPANAVLGVGLAAHTEGRQR